MRPMLRRVLVGAAGLVSITAGPVSAQKAPELGYVFPAGGRAGTTVEVRLGGYDWTPDLQLFVHDRRVRLESTGPISPIHVPPPPYWFGVKSYRPALPLPRELPARFVLPAEVPPGPIRWQVANASGASASGVFMVGGGAEVVEDERRSGPQELTALPVTVSGRLFKLTEVDRYRWRSNRSGPVSCALSARRLGTEMNGILEVRDSRGQLVADAADTEGRDAALTFTAKNGEAYVLSVHDLEFRGDRAMTYRLEVAAGPRLLAAVPASGKRGESCEVEFTGIGLATGAPTLESVRRTVAFPTLPGGTFAYRLETPHGVSLPFELGLSDRPDVAPGSPELPLPGSATGVLARDDRCEYRFSARKGQVVAVAMQARSIGSPVDAGLTLLDADGKELARSDDLAGTTDAGLTWTAPADGVYVLRAADLSGRPPSPTSVFRLVLELPTADFRLQVPAALNVRLGEKAELVVRATRSGGFTGEIGLSVEGLPAGVVPVGPLVIPSGAAELKIPITASADAAAAAAVVTVAGTAMVGGVPVTRPATAPPGPGPLSNPESVPPSAMLIATTLKPLWKADVVDKDGGHRTPRGATYLAEVTVDRIDGFTGDVVLQMSSKQAYHVQGINGPDFPVPNGVRLTRYPCFMPEWLETSRTSRMILVAMGKVRDPRGNERCVLTDVDGRITMSMEGALMKLAAEEPAPEGRLGSVVEVPIRLQRSPRLAESARLELVEEDAASGGSAGEFKIDPLELPAGTQAAVVRLRLPTDPSVVGDHAVTLRAVALQDGRWPVVSQTTLRVRCLR